MFSRVAFAFSAMTLCVSCASSRSDRSLLLTTDAGCEVDDQWAISYALASPELETLGVVTTHAPNLESPAAETSAKVVRELLEILDLPEPPPVYAGASEALVAANRPRENDGVRFIVEASRRFGAENRLVIVTLGATTDVASALLLDPSMAERVEVLTMGFSDWPAGGDPWNIKNDSLAYQVILASGVPITIGSVSVCQKHLTLDRDEVREQTEGLRGVGETLRASSLDWIDKHRDTCLEYTGREAWVIWDLVTIAHLRGFTRADRRPRPRLGPELEFVLSRDSSGKGPEIAWISEVDTERMWRDFRQKFILED